MSRMSNGSVNLVLITGTLGKEVHFTQGSNGRHCAFFSLAVDSSYTDRDNNRVDRTEWIDFKAFGKTAERLQKMSAPKGTRLTIDGHLATETKQGLGQNGQTFNMSVPFIEVDSCQFTERKSIAQQGTSQQHQAPQHQYQQQQPPANNYQGQPQGQPQHHAQSGSHQQAYQGQPPRQQQQPHQAPPSNTGGYQQGNGYRPPQQSAGGRSTF